MDNGCGSGSSRAAAGTLPLVTLDLFSALIDSRRGGTLFFDCLARRRGWEISGEKLYSHWDLVNKELQRKCSSWATFRELSTEALDVTYRDFRLPGEGNGDAAELLASVSEWPTWPDVPNGLEELRAHARLGILSNVDDDIFALTCVASLFDASDVLTSEKLHSYKPSVEIYRAATRRAGAEYVHVAASARDVRGALAAGINTIRVRRPGHSVDPEGAKPVFEVDSLTGVANILPRFFQ